MGRQDKGAASSDRVYNLMESPLTGKMFKAKPKILEMFWVVLGQFTAALGGIVGVRLLTYKLDPVSYGELALGMTIAMFAHQVVLGALGQSSLRYFSPASDRRELRNYFKSILSIAGKITIGIIGAAVILIIALYYLGDTKWVWLFALALIFSIFSGYNGILDGIQNAARQRKVVAWHQGLSQWLRFLLAVFLIIIFGARSAIAMAGYVIAALVIITSQYYFFKKTIVSRYETEDIANNEIINSYTKKLFNYAWPFSVWGFFTWAQMSSDKWALQFFSSTKNIGLYSALYQLSYYPIILFLGLLSQFVTPILFSRAGDGADHERMRNTINLNKTLVYATLVITLIFVSMAYIFHNLIFRLFVSPEYSLVAPLLPLLVLAGGLFSAGQIASLTLMIRSDTSRLLSPKIWTAILGVTLNFAGVYYFGLIGAVWANIIFSLVYFVWISLILLNYDNTKAIKWV